MEDNKITNEQRQHIKQLFCYIRALAERRFGVMLKYTDYGFVLPFSDIPRHPLIDMPTLAADAETADSDLILCVGKAEVPPCPELPRSLIGWIEKGWDNPSKAPIVQDSHEMPSPEAPDQTKTELFTDDKARESDYRTWILDRDQWVQEALPAYNARKVYDTLYALNSDLAREKDRIEFIVGDGIFEAQLEDGTKVCHPVVLERVSLVFNANVPCFTVSACDAGPSLYTRLLRIIPGLESNCLGDFSAQIEEQMIHPFERERFDDLLTSLSNALSSDCEFVKDGQKSSAKFTIKRGAVLLTRSRASGYSAMLDKIISDIDTAEEFSPSLLSIVCEDTEAPDEISVGDGAMEVNGISSDVLLEKAANREQLLIAKKIAVNPAVLVQGPPGTGKTHTISNIIGDLLAKGQSVLVSSQTSKALSVLRDKISEPIRPLCVSVLDDNRKQLESSLNAINDYMSAHNVETLERGSASLAADRDRIIADMTAAKQELIELVQKEYSPLAVDDTQYSPKEAAMLIAELAEQAFIPDAVAPGTKLPLFESELKVLYASNSSLDEHEEALLTCGAPDSSIMMRPKAFARVCAIVGQTDSELTAIGVDCWKNGTERDAALLGELHTELCHQAEKLGGAHEWMLRLAQLGIGDSTAEKSIFESISSALPELRSLASEIKLDLIDSCPTIPDELVNEDTEKLLYEIYSELDTEKINWLTVALHPKWKALLDRCIINGEKCDTKTELAIVCKYHHLLLGRKLLLRRWESAVCPAGGPAISGDSPEEQASLAWPVVSGWLHWYTAEWKPLEQKLCDSGFDMERYLNKLPLEARMEGEVKTVRCALSGDLPTIVESEYLRGDRSQCIKALEDASRALLPYTDDYAELAELRSAVEARDEQAYSTAYDNYDRICLKRDTYVHRTELLDKLYAVCPLWSDSIKKREGKNCVDHIPADLTAHWLRAQLCGGLDERCRISVDEVQKRIEKLNSSLSSVTRELIASKAWCAQLRTMSDPSKKRALATWVELVKRVGKGTGKRAEQLLASGELRTAMKNCRRAVPVWIMPMSSVAEYFEPSDEKFDVLIIDEASQADITAMISLYLAKKVIVVGDDKQVSPTPIGLDIETSAKLRQEFLTGIPAAAMYDELVSIYDLGKANYEPITLKEHFRCADDIINFSNYYTYNGMIRPLRDSRSIKLRPSVAAYKAEDGYSGGKKTNRREAEHIAALIKACTELPQYNGSTIGVITMLGDEQALIIDRILREKLTEAEYQSRQILCGNPSFFQGDERDVIFISMVDSSKEDGKVLTVRRDGYNELYAKRYNVAASRARDQLWVVYSLDPNKDLKADDLRLKLISHALDPASTAEVLHKGKREELTPMEQEVKAWLDQSGFSTTAHQTVGSYTITLICEGDGGRVAIECDGDGVTAAGEIVEQLNMQAVLERLGWRFIRLRASEFYRDREKFFRQLGKKLSELKLTPPIEHTDGTPTDGIDCVTARAAEILAQWDAEKNAESTEPTEPTDALAAQDSEGDSDIIEFSEPSADAAQTDAQ